MEDFITVRQVIKAGVELYTGCQVSDMKLFADPKVDGSWGIRVTAHRKTKRGVHKTGRSMDFILSAHWQHDGRTLTPQLVEKWLEDAMFETWPPKVGAPSFW